MGCIGDYRGVRRLKRLLDRWAVIEQHIGIARHQQWIMEQELHELLHDYRCEVAFRPTLVDDRCPLRRDTGSLME